MLGGILSDVKSEFDPLDQNSHLLSLLRSGHVPDPNEKSSILTTIEDCGVQLDSLNTQLSQLKSIVNQLNTRRSDLELQITYQSGLLSPIRRLPNELLAEILLYSSGGRVNVSSPRSDIWKFERVCKKWRDISLSSEIWASIDVSLESMAPWNPGTPMAMVAHLAELCLHRSRDRSLSVKFEEIGSPVNFKDIFHIFSPYSNRWEELFLSLSMLPPESPIILDYGLNRLNYLRFSGAYKSSTTPLDTFRYAQQLRRLHLFSVPRPLRSLLLPWSQITDFKAVLCIFRTGEFVDILKAMPNVVRFVSRWNKGLKRINNNGADAAADSCTINQIHLPRLKSFELVSFPSETYAILQLLTFPLLTDLTIVSGNSSDPSLNYYYYTLLADSIINAINRSSCRLTFLSLHSVDSACVARILPYTPWVEHLELGYIQSADVILRQLVLLPLPLPSDGVAVMMCGGGGGGVVPSLREFSLECMVDQGVTCIGPLISVIRSRSCCPDDLGGGAASEGLGLGLGLGGGGGGGGGHLQMVNLTLREKRGVDPFAAILHPLGIETGVGIVIHAVQISA